MILEALRNAGLKTSDVDWLLLHQANIRIMEHAADVRCFVMLIPISRSFFRLSPKLHIYFLIVSYHLLLVQPHHTLLLNEVTSPP